MASCAIPKSTAMAAKLLEEYADLKARLALLEEDRSRAIAAANQRADAAAAPMLKRADLIAASIESWWPHAAPILAGDKKSVELGGCMIGTRRSRARLAHGFDDDEKAVEALRKTPYLKRTTKVKYSLDRAATLKLLQLEGAAGRAIAELGFKIDEPGDKFFVERVSQDATIGS
jgi:hypothetical protein